MRSIEHLRETADSLTEVVQRADSGELAMSRGERDYARGVAAVLQLVVPELDSPGETLFLRGAASTLDYVGRGPFSITFVGPVTYGP